MRLISPFCKICNCNDKCSSVFLILSTTNESDMENEFSGTDPNPRCHRNLRYHLGTAGTLNKIRYRFLNGLSPTTVKELVSMSPHLPGQKRMAAAYCFTSILYLKQHGYIKVIKEPGTNAVKDIILIDPLLRQPI